MLWHKCKNGTWVNLEQYDTILLNSSDTRTTKSLLGFAGGSTSSTELCMGSKAECEAELAEIERKITEAQAPLLYMKAGM